MSAWREDRGGTPDSLTGPERLTAVAADPAFFSILGVDAIAGRTFRPDDPLDVAVISARLWRQRFGRDPSLPGRTVRLDIVPAIRVAHVNPATALRHD